MLCGMKERNLANQLAKPTCQCNTWLDIGHMASLNARSQSSDLKLDLSQYGREVCRLSEMTHKDQAVDIQVKLVSSLFNIQ